MTLKFSVYGGLEMPFTLALDPDRGTAYLDGKPFVLTQQEFSLLRELADNANQPVTRDELLRSAWGYASPGETRTVDVHVQRLRRKLGFNSIETIYRTGYRLRAQAVAV